MKKVFVGLILCLVFMIGISMTSTAFARSVDDLELMTENYPPYNFMDRNGLRGISVDLMVLMLKKVNSKQTLDDIKLLPWSDGYSALLNKKNTSLFAATRTEHREKLFKWVGPISSTTIALIARKDKNIKINSMEDVRKYKVGVVIDDIGKQLLVEAGIKLENLDRAGGVDVIPKSIEKLNAGKIDIWSYEENVANWGIKAKGFDPDEYEAVYILEEREQCQRYE